MKARYVILGIILIGIIFFLKIIPNDAVYRTEEQKVVRNEFCAQYGCGITTFITSYQYLKYSLKNRFSES